MHGNSTVQYLQYCMVDRRHVYHSIMMNVTWQNFDQSAEQLIVCYTTNENHALIKKLQICSQWCDEHMCHCMFYTVSNSVLTYCAETCHQRLLTALAEYFPPWLFVCDMSVCLSVCQSVTAGVTLSHQCYVCVSVCLSVTAGVTLSHQCSAVCSCWFNVAAVSQVPHSVSSDRSHKRTEFTRPKGCWREFACRSLVWQLH